MKKDLLESGQPVNKSKAIRGVYAETPTADSKTVIARLAERGIRVSPTMVYYVKSKLGQAKRRAKRERVAASSEQTAAKNPVEVVLRTKDLAREVGGIKNLKMLVDLLAE